MKSPLNKQQFLQQIVRVNHAGEYAAMKMYGYQSRVFYKDPAFQEMIHHMQEQEQHHLDYFTQALDKYQVKPTKLMPIWKAASMMLGYGTALMGKKAAMACTVAVEEVISDHYQEQIDALDDCEMKKKITQFRAEEIEHHGIGIENQAEEATGYKILSAVIKSGCKIAIALSKKI